MGKWKELETIGKFKIFITNFIKITLLLAIPLAVYEQNWMALFVTLLTLLLVFLPGIFEKKYNINLIDEFEVIIIIFIYAGLFLGEARGYYTRFWWWDSLLHAFSGIALGFAGFLILYILYKTGRLKTSLKFIALLSFCFAVALGALWEIFEFLVDSFFGANMQKARGLGTVYYCDTRLGVMDTMWDLILNSLGALFASVTGYFYLKKGEMPILKRIVEKFETKNPALFNKNKNKNKKAG